MQAWLGEMAIGAYKDADADADAAEPDSGMPDVVASIFGNPTANPESPTRAEMAEALDHLGLEIDRLVRANRKDSEPHAIDPDLLAGLRPMNGFARWFGMVFQPDPA